MHADTLKKISNTNLEANPVSLQTESPIDDGTSRNSENTLEIERKKPIPPQYSSSDISSDNRSDSQTPNSVINVPINPSISSAYPMTPDRVLSPPNLTFSMPLPPHASEMAYQPLPASYQYQPYQNVIEMNNNSYGTVTRISNYSTPQTVPTNLAMSVQSPLISSAHYPTNRFSMMAPPPPQQFEINVYNTLPHSKSFGNLYEQTYPQPIPNLQPIVNQSTSNLPQTSFLPTTTFASYTSTETSTLPNLFPISTLPPPVSSYTLPHGSAQSNVQEPSDILHDDILGDLEVPGPPPGFEDPSSLIVPDSPPPLPKTPPPSLKKFNVEIVSNEIFPDPILRTMDNTARSEYASQSLKPSNDSIVQTVEKLSNVLDKSKIIEGSAGHVSHNSESSKNRNSQSISDWMLAKSDDNISSSTVKTTQIEDMGTIPTFAKPEIFHDQISPKSFDGKNPIYQKLVKEMTLTESSSTLLENQSFSRPSTSKQSSTKDFNLSSVAIPEIVTREMSSAYSMEKQFEGGVTSKISHTEQLSPPPSKIIRPKVPPPPVPYKKVPPPVPPKKPTLRSSKSEENILDSESTKEIAIKKSIVRPVSLVFSAKQNFGFGKETLGRYGSLEKVINCFLTYF